MDHINDTSEARVVPFIPVHVNYAKLRRAKRRYVSARTHHRCLYCGSDEDPWTYEHLIPASKGGTDCTKNLVRACGACNLRRGNSLAFAHLVTYEPHRQLAALLEMESLALHELKNRRPSRESKAQTPGPKDQGSPQIQGQTQAEAQA